MKDKKTFWNMFENTSELEKLQNFPKNSAKLKKMNVLKKNY